MRVLDSFLLQLLRVPLVFQQKKCDALIVGCGVVGLATGIALIQRFHGIRVVIAEKEESLGLHPQKPWA